MKHIGRIAVLVVIVLALSAIARPGPSLAGGEARVLVQFAPGRGAAVRAALQGANGNIHYQFDDLNTFAVSLPEVALKGIERNPNVVLVEEDAPRYLMSQETPYGVDMVQALDVWDADGDGAFDAGAPTGAGIKVCIIDSGLFTGHVDHDPLKVTGYGTDWNRDFCGHGTHVAGTIAAVNNDLGVVGVSPNVSLYIVKVFGDDCGWAYSSTLVDATNRCAAAGANVISMSLGGSKSLRTERTQFDKLYSQGILSIAAAGNDGTTAYNYPASYSSVVSVAAIDSNMLVADFSQQNNQVELAAPGVAVLSTLPYVETNSLTVDSVAYSANHIEYAAYGTASGALVDGGLCTATGTWSGKVVLCQRGDISFLDKILNVQNSGGVAAVIYNNVPGGFLGTLDTGTSTIVAISMSQEDGQYLVANKLGRTATVASTLTRPASGYEAWDGTSMATPHVSAVAALLWSSNPNLTNAEIRAAMTSTALDLGAAGRDVAYGYGLVQAKAALDFLGGGTVDNPPSVSITAPTAGATVAGTVTMTANASDDHGVTQVAFFVDGQSLGSDTNGTDGWSIAWDTTTATDAPHTLTAVATDTADQTKESTPVVVTVNNTTTTVTIFVADIAMSGKKAGVNRTATAVVTIKDTNGALVSGATVSGTWSGSYVGNISGTTGADGTVTFTASAKRGTSFTFTVTNVTKTGTTYDPTQNVETFDTQTF